MGRFFQALLAPAGFPGTFIVSGTPDLGRGPGVLRLALTVPQASFGGGRAVLSVRPGAR